ncbi:MAG: transposon-transfer assisting family protein, partial [Bacillus sp. (in: Bacteria)]|nr:transposon-transfer assisting family protein [Bacillus sp. (in: firmicutes)]
LKMNLTYEEYCLIKCFGGISKEREEIIADMESKLPYLDEDMKALSQQTLKKIKNMIDTEFNEEMEIQDLISSGAIKIRWCHLIQHLKSVMSKLSANKAIVEQQERQKRSLDLDMERRYR